ncbi:unnamed protein product [Ectocarpus sp. CCAP 1310/34]|nr:unnamed protein product [Ectocarpus sp. CCAP 1310/34]
MTTGDHHQHSSSMCSQKQRNTRSNDMDVEDVMRSQDWVKATSAISTTTSSGIPARAWRTPLARHLKLVSFLEAGDGCNGNSNINNNSNRVSRDDGGDDYGDDDDDCLLDEEGTMRHHPLHVAASQNILKLGRVLLSPAAAASVDPNVRDGSGRTPLHWAAMTGRVDFALLLLESDAKLDAVDREQRTPLLSSSAFGATNSVRLLLEWGADCCKPSKGGLTPLHAAAAGGHAEAIKLLIDCGASVHARTDMGCNPRHVAERRGHVDVARMLSAWAQRSRSLPSAAGTMVGGNDSWRGGGGGGGGASGNGDRDACEEERLEVCRRHSFDRADLLRRPLFR